MLLLLLLLLLWKNHAQIVGMTECNLLVLKANEQTSGVYVVSNFVLSLWNLERAVSIGLRVSPRAKFPEIAWFLARMVRVNVGIAKLVRAYVAIKSLVQAWPWGSNCSKSYLHLVETVLEKNTEMFPGVWTLKNNERSDLEDLDCYMIKSKKLFHAKNSTASRKKCISKWPFPPAPEKGPFQLEQHFSGDMLAFGGVTDNCPSKASTCISFSTR